MSKRYNKNQNQDPIAMLVIGIFKVIWFLVSLPFKGIKLGNKKRFGLSIDDKNYIVAKRLEIERGLDSENQLELKHIVLEADKLVDYTMQAQGCPGQTFADRLRSIQQNLSQNIYNQIWQGHKVRNQIAHEPELNLSNFEYKEAARKLLEYTKHI